MTSTGRPGTCGRSGTGLIRRWLRRCSVLLVAVVALSALAADRFAGIPTALQPLVDDGQIAGALVVEPDLRAALNKGVFAHTFLDVIGKEPLPADSPWWGDPRVTVTSHISGVMPVGAVIAFFALLFRENLRCVAAGQPPLNEVR
jgi:hypothetical protein